MSARATPALAGWGALGALLLGLWLTVPPVELRTPAPSAVLIVVAAGAGAWVAARGQRRLGISIVVCAIATGAVALGATHASSHKLQGVVVWSALVPSTLANATPLLFAAIGGVISERSGVINIALEGIMLIGAFFGLLGADLTGSWVGGLALATAAGGMTALIYAFFAIQLRANQIVGGLAVNLFAVGITSYLLVDRYGAHGTPQDLPGIPDVHLGFISDVYFVGPALGSLNLMVWLGLLFVVVSHVVLFRTPIGTRLRAVGEKPEAAENAGISVFRVRYIAVVCSGMLGALGGAYLSIGFVHAFSDNMTSGRGYIALASVALGAWRPVGALGAVLLFGFASALALRLQVFSESAATLLQALPYVLTLVLVAGLVRRARAPAADGVPYDPR
jgi:general nucleoside transport system permease protein